MVYSREWKKIIWMWEHWYRSFKAYCNCNSDRSTLMRIYDEFKGQTESFSVSLSLWIAPKRCLKLYQYFLFPSPLILRVRWIYCDSMITLFWARVFLVDSCVTFTCGRRKTHDTSQSIGVQNLLKEKKSRKIRDQAEYETKHYLVPLSSSSYYWPGNIHFSNLIGFLINYAFKIKTNLNEPFLVEGEADTQWIIEGGHSRYP